MSQVETLIRIDLGHVRDAGMRWKLQSLTSAHVERNRQLRRRQNSDASSEGSAPPPVKMKRCIRPPAHPGSGAAVQRCSGAAVQRCSGAAGRIVCCAAVVGMGRVDALLCACDLFGAGTRVGRAGFG